MLQVSFHRPSKTKYFAIRHHQYNNIFFKVLFSTNSDEMSMLLIDTRTVNRKLSSSGTVLFTSIEATVIV